MEVETVPDSQHLRVDRRFGVRIDAEPPGLTAWRDGSRMGWIARFGDVERLAVAIRSVGRWSRLHAIGVTMLGLAGLVFMGYLYGFSALEQTGWVGPVFAVVVVLLLVGWPLEVVSRRAMRRASLADAVLAWKRRAGLGPLQGPPP